MLSERNTQPKLVTEPTMKPMLAAPRHSSTPTCTRCIGCCALALMTEASSISAAPIRIGKRSMEISGVVAWAKARASRRAHHLRTTSNGGHAEFIIGRAFARPGGFAHPTRKRPAFASLFFRIAKPLNDDGGADDGGRDGRR